MWKSIVAIDFNCGKYAKDLDTTETLRQNCVDVSIRDGRGLRRGTIVLTVIVLTVHDRGRLKMRNSFGGLLTGLAAAALLAVPSLAIAQETDGGEGFISLGHVTIQGAPLVSFDISWVDPVLNVYLLGDRSNSSVDVIPIQVNPPGNIKVFGGFAGNIAAAACGGLANACSGPNGVLTLNNPNPAAGRELWVGDGPTPDPVCGGNGLVCSTVKVFNTAGVRTHTISTGGAFRADEMCFAPPDGGARPNGLVMVANNADFPPFISIIATDGPQAYRVVQKTLFPIASGGIEQCAWDPGAQRFLLNSPEINGTGRGNVFVINVNIGAITPGNQAPITPDPTDTGATGNVDNTNCVAPQGIAIGPRFPGTDVLLGCNGSNAVGAFDTVIVNNIDFDVVQVLFGQGGSDEVWFENIAGQHYFVTGGSALPAQNFGITDALLRTQDQNIKVGFTGNTTRRAHSTAGWSGSPPGAGTSVTLAFLPIPPNGGDPTMPFTSTVCGSDAASGCVAVIGAVPIPATEGPGDPSP
jgi:hypothetical protein